MSVIETALTRLLQIKHPILLAPMGSASGGRLAAAVTHAGGLGIIGSGYADSAAIKKELTAAGNARVGIGLVTWALDERPEALDTALAAHPPVLMLSFGSPMPFADAIKRAGCLLMCQVQTLAQAKEAAVSGADIIIAQGRDAGGHAGMTRGTMGLVPAIVDAVGPIPVVAAGGISDGRGLAAVARHGRQPGYESSGPVLWFPPHHISGTVCPPGSRFHGRSHTARRRRSRPDCYSSFRTRCRSDRSEGSCREPHHFPCKGRRSHRPAGGR